VASPDNHIGLCLHEAFGLSYKDPNYTSLQCNKPSSREQVPRHQCPGQDDF